MRALKLLLHYINFNGSLENIPGSGTGNQVSETESLRACSNDVSYFGISQPPLQEPERQGSIMLVHAGLHL